MSKYSVPDAHSRNCPACIRLRDGRGGKKLSLPCRNHTDPSTRIRRSTSSLSYADLGSEKEESLEPSSYLTPTQKKGHEIRKLRAELNKANGLIQAKDKEIICLRNELVKFKGALSPDNCEATSIPDSGNCEDQDLDLEADTSTALQNIDFELMESTLREEEETRLQLGQENQELRFQLHSLSQETQELSSKHLEEIQSLQDAFHEEVEKIKSKNNDKIQEVLRELSESTLRYSRQQETIDKKQQKVEELSARIEELKMKIIRLEEELASSRKNQEKETLEPSSADGRLTSQDLKLLQTQLSTSHAVISSLKSDIASLKVDAEASRPEYLKPKKSDQSIQTETQTKVDNISQVDFLEDLLLKSPVESSRENILLTYQFLRRSIYYFLTDRDNKEYHLKSIERLLQFTEGEKMVIDQQKPVKKY